jgi:hypothetical protein
MNWSFWLLAVGLTLMVADLTIAGLVEAQVWASSAPWIESVRAVASYWLVRTFSGLPILAGFILFWTSLISGPRPSTATAPAASREASEDIAAEGDASTSHEAPSTGRLSYAHAVIFGAGVGFFALSFLVLAILPGNELEDEIERAAPVTMPTLTAAEQRGRVVYGREGCAYCHTQQIRFLADDVRRFGAPTEPWETKYEYPQLWGPRRKRSMCLLIWSPLAVLDSFPVLTDRRWDQAFGPRRRIWRWQASPLQEPLLPPFRSA